MNDLEKKTVNYRAPEFTLDNISIQGFSHKNSNKECQDSSLVWEKRSCHGAIVCDGHGGDKYFRSAIGSKLACEVGKELISAFVPKFRESWPKSNRKIEDDLTYLENAIVSEWRSKVEAHYSENPFDEKDERFMSLEEHDRTALKSNPIKAYGTTFIGAVLTGQFSFIIQLGDGNAVLFYEKDPPEMPTELVDSELQFNVTTSLCNNDAARCFRHCYKNFTKKDEKKVIGVTLTSDGIINCYHTEEAYKSFMKNIFAAYGEESKEDAHNELQDVLEVLSEKGSGDDLSVAIVRRMDYAVPQEESNEEVTNSEKSERDIAEYSSSV